MKNLDWYLGLAVASLAMTGPFSIAALTHAHAGDSWFFTLLPGVGMALCGTLGNAAVVGALLALKMPASARVFLVAVAVTSFAAMFFVLSTYLYASYSSLRVTDVLPGFLAFSWFLALLVMSELQASAMVVISIVRRTQHAEAARTVAEVAGEHRTPVPPMILAALDRKDGQTLKELAAITGVTVSTVSKHCKDLAAERRIHGRQSLEKRAMEWWLGEAA